MDLLSGISPPENEMALSRALLFGNRPANDTVLSIASDGLFQDDLIRLDGPFIPNGKKASDIWLNNKILACFRHFLIANDKNLCEQSPGRQPNYFADSYLYMQMMQERRTDAKKGKYSYCSVVGRCKRSTEGNLLKFGAAYLPILLGENHWIGGVILPAKKDVLLYNPSGVDNRNSVVLQNLLRLIGDEYKRMHNSSDEAVEAYLGQWSLIDAATDNGSAFPLQDNGKC